MIIKINQDQIIKEVKLKIEHISVSRADTYKQCPAKYKYRYHLGILPEKEEFHFTFGKIVHKIIEEYTEERGNRPLSEVAKDVIEGKIELEKGRKAPPLDSYAINRLNLHASNFIKLSGRIGLEGVVEYPFDIDIDPPNGRKWVGFIDRIIHKKDKVFILDYKTTKPGKFRKNHQTIKTDLQIKGYCYIAREKFKVPAENIRAALYYIEDDTLIDSGKFSEQELDSVPKELLAMYKEIEGTNELSVVGKTGDHCKFCPYSKICPDFKEWRTGKY